MPYSCIPYGKFSHVHVFAMTLLIAMLFCSISLQAQDSNAVKQQAGAVKNEEGTVKKKAGFISALFKKFSKEARQAKKLAKAGHDSLQVFGWHVHWLDSTLNTYNYNELSTLSYYACSMILQNGMLQYSAPGWNSESTKKMISLAKGDNCTVLLTLKIADKATIIYLLENADAQKRHISYMMDLIDNVQQADGINVVFDNMPDSRSGQLTKYIKSLSLQLKQSGKYLVLALPSMDPADQYDIKSLAPSVDQFIVQGYNYHNTKSDQAGPVAPLEGGQRWGPFDITRSVNTYLRAGLPKSKFILALPYYGALWRMDTLRSGKVKHVFVGHHRYSQIMTKLNDLQSEYDSVSHTMIGRFVDDGKAYLFFYENKNTLGYKYSWVKRRGLAGIAIWALGYDGGRDELWQHIAKSIDVVKLPAKPDSKTDSASPAADGAATGGKDDSTDKKQDTAGNTTNDTSGTSTTGNATEEEQSAVDGNSTGGQSGTTSENAQAGDAGGLPAGIVVPSFFEKYSPVFSNAKILMVGGITLVIFILLGVLKSLFYPEVYSKLMIEDIKTYGKVTLTFVLIFIAILVTAKLVFHDELLSEDIEQSGAKLYPGIVRYVWIAGIAVWVAIQMLSIKTFLRLNSDLP